MLKLNCDSDISGGAGGRFGGPAAISGGRRDQGEVGGGEAGGGDPGDDSCRKRRV